MRNSVDTITLYTKEAADVSAVSVSLSAWLGYAPDVAAVLAGLWTLVRLYEWAEARFFKKPPSGKDETE